MLRFGLLTFFVLIFWSNDVAAKVHLPKIFGDHMVMQQKAFAPIWGRAKPGERIAISPSWEGIDLHTYADSKGLWRMDIPTPEAGGPFTIRIAASDSDTILIKDILMGEVWLASGQSNMGWPLNRSENADKDIPMADHPEIRLFSVGREVASTPRYDCKGVWEVCTPESASEFSAVAYYFAKKLQGELNVPIGIIESAWGGTPAEAWTSRGALESDVAFGPMLERYNEELRNHRENPKIFRDPIHATNPTTLFNAMIHPMIPFMIRGAIWYQGESNTYDPVLYRKLFPKMIQDWRQQWHHNFSFYYVQIAPFEYDVPLSGSGIREAQLQTLKVPKTGMAVTMDIGNPKDIHPKNKHDVGDRLARWALAKDYGKKNSFSGPIYKKMEEENGAIRLHFSHADDGLESKNGALMHFEIAGEDQKFYPANAKIDGETVVVSSEKVSQPVAVRFAFGNADVSNLFNGAGLPASSFRTDNWPIFFNVAQIQPKYQPASNTYEITLAYPDGQAHDLYYTIDGQQPTRSSWSYDKPFTINPGTQLTVRAFDGEVGAGEVATLKLISHQGLGSEVRYTYPFNLQYAAGKKTGLVDGILASDNLNSHWQGFYGTDMEVIIDLGERKSLSKIETHFFHQPETWIFLPREVVVSVAKNAGKFEEVANIPLPETVGGKPAFIHPVEVATNSKKIRYIKLTAKSAGPLPNWHPGAGKKSWMFVDEVIVE